MRKYSLVKHLKEYCKEEGIALEDIKKDLLKISLDLSRINVDIEEENQSEEFLGFHQKLVQEVIDFICGNKKISEMIYIKREAMKQKLVQELEISYSSEISVSLNISGLHESLKNGKWVPSTDSFLDISVGGFSVIFSA